MTGELRVLREQAEAELRQAGTEEAFQAIRTRYLGRKGLLTGLLRNIANVAPGERPQFGKECNEVKEELSARIDELLAGLASSKKDEISSANGWMSRCPGGASGMGGSIRSRRCGRRYAASLPVSVSRSWKGRKSNWITIILRR